MKVNISLAARLATAGVTGGLAFNAAGAILSIDGSVTGFQRQVVSVATSEGGGPGPGDDNLTGTAGDDLLDGLGGADTMTGLAGNDVYVVDNAGDTVAEGANEGSDKVQASVSYTLPVNVENLDLTGTSKINGTGNGLENTLIGNSANNVLNGKNGNDTMVGLGGNDTYLVYESGDVVVEGVGGGTDRIRSKVSYTLPGNVENLYVISDKPVNATGNSLANKLIGNAEANTVNGKAGADTMTGAAGDDTYYVDNVGDVVVEIGGGGANDTIRSSVTYSLPNAVENLILRGTLAISGTGNGLHNILTGNDASNSLRGGKGNDVIRGYSGNDKLAGGLGADSLRGDAGRDKFLFNTTLEPANIDSIADFVAADDTIELDNAVFTTLSTTGTLAASHFWIGLTATMAAHRIIYDRGTGALLYDADGNGTETAAQFATLKTKPALSNADIVVQSAAPMYGLEWPGDGAVRRMLYWHDPFPIYDATYIFRVYPRKKPVPPYPNGYYTTFFWGNDGTFIWDGGNANTYYGAHPYPVPTNIDPGQWEISVYANDYVTGTEVVWDRWYTQAFRAWRESASTTHHEFYWDLPDTSKVIRKTIVDSNWAARNPPAPAIVIGQAPDLNGASWGGYEGWEEFNGIIRGIQIYSGLLSVADIHAEIAMPESTDAGHSLIWYLNLNPRPGDVTDKKTTGTPNNPSWDGTPALGWTK